MKFAEAGKHPLRIRNAESSDAPEIERLYQELVPADASVCVLRERVEQVAADPASLLLVADNAGRLVGSTFVTMCLDVMYRNRPFLVVENIIVESTNRGMGVGRRLLDAVDQVAVETDASKIMLLSNVARADAHGFFEVCGYIADVKRGFVRYRSSIAGKRA